MFLKIVLLLCVVVATNAKYGFKMGDVARIVGGSKATEGQFPYQVSMQLGIGEIFTQHFCGGSILNERIVITAAHCVLPVLEYELTDYTSIRAGTTNIKNPLNGQTVAAQKLLHHSQFTVAEPGPYDIGVVILKAPLQMSSLVMPIVLPQADAIPEGNANLSGWGAVSPDGKSLPTDLQFAKLPLVPYQQCKEAYDNQTEENPLAETNICTGPMSGGQSACSGDSGGPLVQVNDKGENVLIGIVSWGVIPCGSQNAPTVYTRVSAYLDYIAEVSANY